MGDHSHINNGTHRLPRIWPFIFTPYISLKPLFLPKIVTQSPIFFTPSRILEIFHSKTPNRLEFEKKVPKCPLFFMAFVTERPPIFCLAYTWFVWGECCSLKHGQKLENFVFSKQNRAIWWILSGANLIKVMKIKFQFYRLNWPNCALSGWISLEGRDDIQAVITLVKHGRGYILQPPSINLHTLLSKQMASVPDDVPAEAF